MFSFHIRAPYQLHQIIHLINIDNKALINIDNSKKSNKLSTKICNSKNSIYYVLQNVLFFFFTNSSQGNFSFLSRFLILNTRY